MNKRKLLAFIISLACICILDCCSTTSTSKEKELYVKKLINKLSDKDHYIRDKTINELARIGKPAVQPLIAALKDENAVVRINAAKALGYIADKRAVEPLIAVLNDEAWYVRRKAAESLGEIGDARAVEPLIAALKDDDEIVQEAAAEALEKIGWKPLTNSEKAKFYFAKGEWVKLKELGKPAVEQLIATFKDGGSIRWEAADTLAQIGKPPVELLIAALKHENYSVRREAAEALEKIEWEPSSDTEKVKFYFAKGKWDKLTQIGKPPVELLIAALKDKDDYVRLRAAEALEEIGWEPSSDTEKAQFYLAKREWDKLIKLGKPAVEPLIAALKNRDDYVRRYATVALGKIGDTRAIEPLIAALKDEDEDVREGAVESLGEIRDARAVVPLIAALKDNDEDVQYAAAKVLKEITGEDFGKDYEAWSKWWEKNREKFLKRSNPSKSS
jgi:HEAT repeat protein